MTDLARLAIDIDRRVTACSLTRWGKMAGDVLAFLEIKPVSVEVRQTRRGLHLLFILAEPLASPLEVVAVQAILGSDNVREAMNLKRAQSATLPASWNLLYLAMRKDGKTYHVQKRDDWAALVLPGLRVANPEVVVSQTALPA